MSIYLAGPISAKTPQKEAENKLRFFAKANELEGLGVEVYNPAADENGDESWAYYLAQDLQVIYSKLITGAYFMKGWEDSKGSVLEMEACIRKQKDDPNFLITKEQ